MAGDCRHEHRQPDLLSQRDRGRARDAREQVRHDARRGQLPLVRRARRARRDGDADCRDRGVVAGARLDPLDAGVLRDAGDTAPDPRHRLRSSGVDVNARRLQLHCLPRGHCGVRRRPLVARDLRSASLLLGRPRLFRTTRGVRRDMRERRRVRRCEPLFDRADVPLLRHLLSGDPAAEGTRVGGLRDAALARGGSLSLADARHGGVGAQRRPRGVPRRVGRNGARRRVAHVPTEVAEVTAAAVALPRGAALFERNARAHSRHFLIIFSGFFEPLFYLLSMGVGLGHYVGKVPGPNGELVSYASFIAPALLATAAMNGAMYDASATFWKMKYMKLYDSVLATPLGPLDVAIGELTWALFRGLLYAITFLITVSVLGDVESPWALLALPAALLVGFGFAGMGMAGATYMRSWQDFEFLNLVQLPLFLFSATFYPLSVYPHWLQIVVRCTPLYNAISLIRGLMLGALGPYQLVNAAYLVVFGAIGLTIARRRIGKPLLT